MPLVREPVEQPALPAGETDGTDPEHLKYARPASALNSEILTSSAAARYLIPTSHYHDFKPEYKESDFVLLTRENRSISIDSLSISQEVADEFKALLPDLKPDLKKKSIVGRTAYLWEKLVAATKAKEYRKARLSVSFEKKATLSQANNIDNFELNQSDSNRQLPSAPTHPIDAEIEAANTDTACATDSLVQEPVVAPLHDHYTVTEEPKSPVNQDHPIEEGEVEDNLQEIDIPFTDDVRYTELSLRGGIKNLVWDSTDLDITFEPIPIVASQLIQYPDLRHNPEESEAEVVIEERIITERSASSESQEEQIVIHPIEVETEEQPESNNEAPSDSQF